MDEMITWQEVPAELIPFYRRFRHRATNETLAVAERLNRLPPGHALKIKHASRHLHVILRNARALKWLEGYQVKKRGEYLLLMPRDHEG